ncbi:MAG: amidohydrolase, partial [Gemmatimonadetes bacterium]|nr:amidohydrolase [Gemmatimonadota bacterium]
ALRAGALAVGGSVTITTLPGYMPLRQHLDLAEIHRRNAVELVGEENVREFGLRGGSTDMGDVTQIMPAIHPFAGGVSGRSHGEDLVVEDYGVAVLAAAKAMAMTVVDLLGHDARRASEIVAQFKPAMTREEYLSRMRSLQSEQTYAG